MANTLEAERKRPDVSYLASPPASWIDDFLQWTNPTFESCCPRTKAQRDAISAPRATRTGSASRVSRGREWDITMNGLPESTEFKFLP